MNVTLNACRCCVPVCCRCCVATLTTTNARRAPIELRFHLASREGPGSFRNDFANSGKGSALFFLVDDGGVSLWKLGPSGPPRGEGLPYRTVMLRPWSSYGSSRVPIAGRGVC